MKVLAISGIIGIHVAPYEVRSFLDEAKGADVRFDIGSPGGFVMPGLEIFNLIRDYKGKTEVRLMGLAASMASYIALAADKRTAHDNAVYMIHNVLGVSVGDHRELRATADNFEKLTNLLAREYAKVTGRSINDMRDMMDKETFLFGPEIAENGFVHEIIKTDKEENRDEAVAVAKSQLDDCIAQMKAHEKAASDFTQAAAYLNAFEPEPVAGATSSFKDYPVDSARGWDSTAAVRRWREKSGSTDEPSSEYKNGFFWYDTENPENFGSYKLPFVDVVGGQVKAIRRGVFAANGAMKGARGGVQIPQADRPKVQAHIDKYLNKIEEEAEDMKLLDDFLNENPAARAEYDKRIANAEAQGAKAMQVRIDKCAAVLGADYPKAITAMAVKVLKGEEEPAALSGAVAVLDAQKEQAAEVAAIAASTATGNTPPNEPGVTSKDGMVASEEDMNEAAARLRGGVK